MAKVRVPEQKVILCGEYGVGKTSLFRRFAMNTFVEATDRTATMGLDYYMKSYAIGDQEVKLQLFDTGGMERVASVTSSYYKFAEAAILVFAVNSRESFNLLSQHLLEVVAFAESAKVFICANKIDLQNKSEVSDDEVEIFCEQFHNVVTGVFKTSCKTNEGIEQMFSHVARTLSMQNRGRWERESLTLDSNSFRIIRNEDSTSDNSCVC